MPLPPVPMLSGGGSGKVLMVLGVLVAVAMVVQNQKKKTNPQASL
jgi:hypothetical protein